MNPHSKTFSVWSHTDNKAYIRNGELHIWKIEVSSLISILPSLKSTLSEDELIRATNYRFEKDRNTYIVIRGALRVILGKYLSRPASSITFKYNQYGKPYVQSISKQPILHFNVSHSGNIGLLIFSMGHEVGIDVEQVKVYDSLLSIAMNNFSHSEIIALKSAPENQQVEIFYECWTKKEALIKAKGIGLSYPLNQLSISMNEDRIYDEIWRLSKITVDDGYKAAYAYASEINQISYSIFDNSTMAANIQG